MKKILLFTLFLIPLYSINAQSKSELKSMFKTKIADIHKTNGTNSSINNSDFDVYVELLPQVIFSEIKKYKKDTLNYVTYFLVDMEYKLLNLSKDSTIKQKACLGLINYCRNKNSIVRERASSYLKLLKKSDFNKQARDLLASYLDLKPEIYQNIVKIIGYLDMKSQIPKLYEIFNDSTATKFSTWETSLALSRLGEQPYYCTNFVMSFEMNDKIIHYMYSDLIYTRNRIAFDFLIQQLNNDDKLCRPANPYINEEIICGYRIMELLAPVIKDFPYKIDRSTNQIITNDYDKALKKVREWFEEHPDYVILTDEF